MRSFLITQVLFAAILLCGSSPSGAQETREVRRTVSFHPDGRVFVDTYKGSVHIKTWDKSEVEITATIEADGRGRHEEEKVRNTEVVIDDSPDRIDIRSDYHRVKEHDNWFWGIFDGETGSLPFVHYTISLPRAARVEIKDYKSEIRLADLRGDLSLNTYKGNVRITGLEGDVRLETYKGDVTISLSALSERYRFETYKGRIELSLPRNAGFDLETDLGRRAEFTTDFETGGHHRRDDNYRSKVNGGGPVLRIESEKGDIRILQSI